MFFDFWKIGFTHLENDPSRADQHSHREYPEEESVQDHGHILPVLENLQRDNVSSSESQSQQTHFNSQF